MEGTRALGVAKLPGAQQRGSIRRQGSTCNRRKAVVTVLLLATCRLCLGIDCSGWSEGNPMEVNVGKGNAKLVLEEGCDQVADSSLVVFLIEHLEPTETINISQKIGNVTGNCRTSDPDPETDPVVLALLKQEAGRCAVLCSEAATPCFSLQKVNERAQALLFQNLVMARDGPPGVLIRGEGSDIVTGVVAENSTVLIVNSTLLAQGGAGGDIVRALEFPAQSVSGLYVQGTTFANAVEPGTGAVLGVPAVFSGVNFTGAAPSSVAGVPVPAVPGFPGLGPEIQPTSSSPPGPSAFSGSVPCVTGFCRESLLQQGGRGSAPDAQPPPNGGVLEVSTGASVLLHDVTSTSIPGLALVHRVQGEPPVFATGSTATEYAVMDSTGWAALSPEPQPFELQTLDEIGKRLLPQADSLDAEVTTSGNSGEGGKDRDSAPTPSVPPLSAPPASDPPPGAATSPGTASDGGSFGTQAVAGVAAAVVIALVAIAAGTLFLLARRRRRKQFEVTQGGPLESKGASPLNGSASARDPRAVARGAPLANGLRGARGAVMPPPDPSAGPLRAPWQGFSSLQEPPLHAPAPVTAASLGEPPPQGRPPVPRPPALAAEGGPAYAYAVTAAGAAEAPAAPAGDAVVRVPSKAPTGALVPQPPPPSPAAGDQTILAGRSRGAASVAAVARPPAADARHEPPAAGDAARGPPGADVAAVSDDLVSKPKPRAPRPYDSVLPAITEETGNETVFVTGGGTRGLRTGGSEADAGGSTTSVRRRADATITVARRAERAAAVAAGATKGDSTVTMMPAKVAEVAQPAASEEELEAFALAIDGMGERELLFERYSLWGDADLGDPPGADVIHPAYDVSTGVELNLHLFIRRESYERALALMTAAAPAALFVAHASEDDDGDAVAASGYRWPPTLAVRRAARTMQQWMDGRGSAAGSVGSVLRAGPAAVPGAARNTAEALRWLEGTAARLAALHGAGWVHCDLQPTLVEEAPSDGGGVVLSGLEKATRLGDCMPRAFTLQYAAPEVAAAYVTGAAPPAAAAAADIWSLGVLALEALVATRAFPPAADTPDAILVMLAGDAPLPWEAGRVGGGEAGLAAFLGGPLGTVIAACLARDAARRPHAQAVVDACAGQGAMW